MSLRNIQEIMLAKLETVRYTDAAPTGADAVFAGNIKAMPFNAETVKRFGRRLAFGSNQELTVGLHAGIEFDIEAVGSGTLGTAPAVGKFLKACGCQEDVVAVTSVSYKPSSPSTDTLTIYYHMDGQKHALLGARGTWQLKFNSQGIPVYHFKFIGVRVPPTATANPGSLTGLADYPQPSPVTFANTPTISLHSYAAVLKSCDIDQGNDVQFFDDPGLQEVDIMSRDSKGSIQLLAPSIASKDYWAAAAANTLGNLLIVHGAVAASRVIFEAAGNRCQITKPDYGTDKGRATLSASLVFVPTSANDDEWVIRYAAA
jgi:hypothetical protein